jgi:hypothetical protein
LDALTSPLPKITEQRRNVLIFETQNSLENIRKLKAHLIRGQAQELAKTEAINWVKSNAANVLIIIDFAMKMLPSYFREGSNLWFAKRGWPWHITCVFLNINGKLVIICYVHVFNVNISQDGMAVLAIIKDVLESLKKDFPEVKCARLRSDNAGCYHGNSTLPFLAEVARSSGICIQQYDFSEAQCGKGKVLGKSQALE